MAEQESVQPTGNLVSRSPVDSLVGLWPWVLPVAGDREAPAGEVPACQRPGCS